MDVALLQAQVEIVDRLLAKGLHPESHARLIRRKHALFSAIQQASPKAAAPGGAS
jgi:hypothetical protein